MNRILGSILLIALAGWTWEHPTPTGAVYEAAAGYASIVHLVGQRGAIAVSRDGGTGWQNLASGVTADLHAVAETPQLAIAVGDRGTILRSRDGVTFDVRPSGITAPLIAVAIAAKTIVALAGDGTIAKSIDGGDSFSTTRATTASKPRAIALTASGQIVVGADDGLYVDGTRVVTDMVQRIALAPNGTIHALAQSRVVLPTTRICNSCVNFEYPVVTLYSSGDGKTWKHRALTTPPATKPYGSYGPAMVMPAWEAGSLSIGPAGEIVIGSDHVYVSTDRGATFTSHDPHGSIIASTGFVSIAPLERSTDRGATWRALTVRQAAGAVTALAASATRVFAVGADGAMLVRDGGAWSARALPIAKTQRLNAVATTGDTVVVVGDRGVILVSTDGGKTFGHRAIERIDDLSAVTATGDDVFAAGRSALYRSRDRGASWDSIATPDPYVRTLWAASPTELYAIGQSLRRSTDRGATWSVVSTAGDWMRGMHGEGTERMIVGLAGRMLVSTDAGKTWADRATGTTDELARIWGRGTELVTVGAAVMRSHDHGKTWIEDQPPTASPLLDVAVIGSSIVVLAGDSAILAGAL